MPVTPWHLQRRPGAAIPSLALALAACLLAGCVTVTDQSSSGPGVVLAAQAPQLASPQLPSPTADHGALASRPDSTDVAPRSSEPSPGVTATDRARTVAPALPDPTASPSTPAIGPSPLAAMIASEEPAETASPTEALAELASVPPTTAPSALPSPSGAGIPRSPAVPRWSRRPPSRSRRRPHRATGSDPAAPSSAPPRITACRPSWTAPPARGASPACRWLSAWRTARRGSGIPGRRSSRPSPALSMTTPSSPSRA